MGIQLFSGRVMPNMEVQCICGHKWKAGKDDASVNICPLCKNKTRFTVDSSVKTNVDLVLRNAREKAGYRCKNGEYSV